MQVFCRYLLLLNFPWPYMKKPTTSDAIASVMTSIHAPFLAILQVRRGSEAGVCETFFCHGFTLDIFRTLRALHTLSRPSSLSSRPSSCPCRRRKGQAGGFLRRRRRESQ